MLLFGLSTSTHSQQTEEFLTKFMEMLGLPRVLEVLLSQSIDVQIGAMALLANLVLNGDCREALKKLGLVEKLKAFAKHRMSISSFSPIFHPFHHFVVVC